MTRDNSLNNNNNNSYNNNENNNNNKSESENSAPYMIIYSQECVHQAAFDFLHDKFIIIIASPRVVVALAGAEVQ